MASKSGMDETVVALLLASAISFGLLVLSGNGLLVVFGGAYLGLAGAFHVRDRRRMKARQLLVDA